MARGRSRATYFPRTKGHSILPQRSYLYPRSTYAYDEDYVPSYRAPTRFYPGSDYYVADAMSSHATTMSTDTVYDNMDLAAKSRGKDQRLMTQVNAALAYATPSTPARARASARANRQQQKAPVYPASYYPAYSVPPEGDLGYEPVVNTDRYDRFNLRSAPRPTQRSARKVYSSGSIASKAVPRPSSGKSIRETEGYSKPKNLLSWQARRTVYN